MKRLRLAGKLALAIIPIGLVALTAGGFVAWSFLERAAAQEEAARAAIVGVEAMATLRNIWSEEQAVSLGTVSMGPVHAGVDTAFDRLKAEASNLDKSASPGREITATIAEVESALAAVRASGGTEGYEPINDLLVSIVSHSSFFIADRDPARELAAAGALSEAARTSFRQEQLRRAASEPAEVKDHMEILESVFSGWIARALVSSHSAAAVLEVPNVAAVVQPVNLGAFPVDRDQLVLDVAQDLAGSVALQGIEQADRTRTEALVIGAGVAVVLLMAGWASFRIGRSMVQRVRSVSDAARRVADVDLPNLVHALRNPAEHLEAPEPVDFTEVGPDEVGELARSFSALHAALVDVAGQQMEILRRGVSEIFVTLARRNRTLVDRQLALIDELESREEDPEILGGYYKLDHLATRMRRNAESLLVLAGTTPPRVWAKPLDMNDVIRAALGEVDDYQRIDILAVEPARLAGSVVTDVAHLMSELLDNATQYSPPTDRVRITGLFDQEGYVLTIADRGLGMSEGRRAEINRLLEKPPVLGLALDPTLGMYVVARLAARHGISVRLVPGVPGITARITIPRTLLESAMSGEGSDPAPSDEEIASAMAPWFEEHRPTAARNGSGGRPETAPYSFIRGGVETGEARRLGEGLSRRNPGEALARASDAIRRPASEPTAPSPEKWVPEVTSVPATPAKVEANPPEAKATPPEKMNLTDPSPAPLPPPVSTSSLPTRTPGTFFTEQLAGGESTSPSEMGAEGIRSALGAFRSGRESAGRGEDEDEKGRGEGS